jgi:hypothetical protein
LGCQASSFFRLRPARLSAAQGDCKVGRVRCADQQKSVNFAHLGPHSGPYNPRTNDFAIVLERRREYAIFMRGEVPCQI